jgi:hypothetical protein
MLSCTLLMDFGPNLEASCLLAAEHSVFDRGSFDPDVHPSQSAQERRFRIEIRSTGAGFLIDLDGTDQRSEHEGKTRARVILVVAL